MRRARFDPASESSRREIPDRAKACHECVPIVDLVHVPIMLCMPLHIGIVACSAEGAALCYRTICSEGARLLGAHSHPEVSMHTPPLSDYVRFLERNDWNGVGELMLASGNKLAAIGADFMICPDNTIHQAFGYVETAIATTLASYR